MVPPIPGTPPAPGGAPPAPPGPPPAPTGAATPVTNPTPASESPKATQSPPDLANMYIQLMKDNKNAAALDSGAHLIAAGFSPYMASRVALIQGSTHAGGAAGHQMTAADLINLQKQQQANKDMLQRRAMLGGLAKQYGLSPEAAFALESSGKMDELIKELETKGLTVHEDSATGQKGFYDRNGKLIVQLGGPKPVTGTPVKTEEGPTILTNPHTGEAIGAPIGGNKPITGTPVKTEEGPTILTNPQTGEPIGAPIGGPKVLEDERVLGVLNKGLPPDQQIDMKTYLTTIKRAAPNATNEAILATINKTRTPDKQMGMEELVKLLHPGAQTNVYIGPDGAQHPAPPPGMDYKRTIGPDGKPVLEYGSDGLPIQVPIGSKSKADTTKAEAEAELEVKKAADAKKKEIRQKMQSVLASNHVGNAVDRALVNADKLGATGVGSKLSRAMLPIGGMSWDSVDANLSTINSNTAQQAIREMRESSPSGATGLGAITDYEQKMLASTISDLRAYQDTDQLKEGLIRTKAVMIALAHANYTTADAGKFGADVKEIIDQLTAEQVNKSSSKIKITPRSK